MFAKNMETRSILIKSVQAHSILKVELIDNVRYELSHRNYMVVHYWLSHSGNYLSTKVMTFFTVVCERGRGGGWVVKHGQLRFMLGILNNKGF